MSTILQSSILMFSYINFRHIFAIDGKVLVTNNVVTCHNTNILNFI